MNRWTQTHTGHESSARRRWISVLVVMVIAVAASFTSTSARTAMLGDSASGSGRPERPSGGKEYRVKALYLLHFASYTSWPKGTFAEADSPIVFGIVGRDPFGTEIDKMLKDKKVGQRPVTIWRFSKVEDVSGVHVLFVGRLSRKEREQLKVHLAGKPVLTIGDDRGMAGKGVIAGFYLEKKQVRFEISVQAFRDSKLAISPQLLKLARIVDRKREPDVDPVEKEDK